MGFEINADKLKAKLEKLENLDINPAIERACILVENEAKKNCPVDTGELRRSITHEMGHNEGQVGTNLHYAPYVEYGTGLFSSQGNGRKDVPWWYQDSKGKWHQTSGQKPQPFLIPAFLNNRNKIMEYIKNHIEEGLS